MGITVISLPDEGFAVLNHILTNHDGVLDQFDGRGVTPIVAGWLQIESNEARKLLESLESDGWIAREITGKRTTRVTVTDFARTYLPQVPRTEVRRVMKERPIYIPEPEPTVESLTEQLRYARAEIKGLELKIVEKDAEIVRLQKQMENMNARVGLGNGGRRSWSPRETSIR